MRSKKIAASNLNGAVPRIALSFFAVLHENKHRTWAGKESPMITVDSSLITALAALVTSLAGLVWAFRRKQ